MSFGQRALGADGRCAELKNGQCCAHRSSCRVAQRLARSSMASSLKDAVRSDVTRLMAQEEEFVDTPPSQMWHGWQPTPDADGAPKPEGDYMVGRLFSSLASSSGERIPTVPQEPAAVTPPEAFEAAPQDGLPLPAESRVAAKGLKKVQEMVVESREVAPPALNAVFEEPEMAETQVEEPGNHVVQELQDGGAEPAPGSPEGSVMPASEPESKEKEKQKEKEELPVSSAGSGKKRPSSNGRQSKEKVLKRPAAGPGLKRPAAKEPGAGPAAPGPASEEGPNEVIVTYPGWEAGPKVSVFYLYKFI